MNDWIDVTKTRDYLDVGYLMVWMKGGIRNIGFAQWKTGHGWMDEHGHSIHAEVTHYMPLPNEPEDE